MHSKCNVQQLSIPLIWVEDDDGVVYEVAPGLIHTQPQFIDREAGTRHLRRQGEVARFALNVLEGKCMGFPDIERPGGESRAIFDEHLVQGLAKLKEGLDRPHRPEEAVRLAELAEEAPESDGLQLEGVAAFEFTVQLAEKRCPVLRRNAAHALYRQVELVGDRAVELAQQRHGGNPHRPRLGGGGADEEEGVAGENALAAYRRKLSCSHR